MLVVAAPNPRLTRRRIPLQSLARQKVLHSQFGFVPQSPAGQAQCVTKLSIATGAQCPAFSVRKYKAEFLLSQSPPRLLAQAKTCAPKVASSLGHIAGLAGLLAHRIVILESGEPIGEGHVGNRFNLSATSADFRMIGHHG